MRTWINNLLRSFPVRLLLLHTREQVFLLLIWVFLWLLMTGRIMNLFGIRFLMLLPEYTGQTGMMAFALLGTAFGAMLTTWNLVSYLLHASKFPFLAALARPFTKFALNNSLIPLAFVVLFFVHSAQMQQVEAGFDARRILFNFLAFASGTLALLLLVGLYLGLTNKDIHQLKPGEIPGHLLPGPRPGNRLPSTSLMDDPARVNGGVAFYLNERLRLRRVRSVSHYEPALLKSVYRQNHLNTLLFQVVSLIVLILLGVLEEIPVLRIPAGASIYIMSSMGIALVGAISYWFGPWRLILFLGLLFLIEQITGYRGIRYCHEAYGIDYVSPNRPVYTNASLDSVFTLDRMNRDRDQVGRVLDHWLARQGGEKPVLVVLASSGGGLKSAVWTLHVLNQLERKLDHPLLPHVALMTGASGGTFGLAYQRELWLRHVNGDLRDYTDRIHVENMSHDLLNSVAFSLATNDLFFPGLRFTRNSLTYRKDRGYSFEMQFHENTFNLLDKTLGDYRDAEESAEIPMLLISPAITNDGRRLLISPQPVSFLCRPSAWPDTTRAFDLDGVDFGTFFRDRRPDHLAISSALRMNATYPYILPQVSLPSDPDIEVMDAGFRDNYGITLAARFLDVYQEWIREHTSGVVLVQIRSWDKEPKIRSSGHAGLISDLFQPLGIIGQQVRLQDFDHDNLIAHLTEVFGADRFHLVRFIYQPGENQDPASMSFHLTSRERDNIFAAWDLPHNRAARDTLVRLLSGR